MAADAADTAQYRTTVLVPFADDSTYALLKYSAANGDANAQAMSKKLKWSLNAPQEDGSGVRILKRVLLIQRYNATQAPQPPPRVKCLLSLYFNLLIS
jgi:hypothetical protein